MSTDTDRLFSIKEAVELGYGAHSTLRLYIRQGRLPAVRIGRRVKIRRSDLEALARPVEDVETFDAIIDRLVDAAPPLTADQAQRLRGLLTAGGGSE